MKKEKIPKKIHYVWVGGSEKSNDIKKCMKTWKKYLKNYEIIEWNENNFDINSHPFTKEAYKKKKWAFVSDYIRAKVLYEEGGIYLDTDVILLDNFDKLLNDDAFVGFENDNYIFTAVIGMKPMHPFMKDILDYYDNVHFEYKKENEMDYVNTKIFTNILQKKYKLKLNNQEQILNSNIKVYPDKILCNPSNNSVSIHIFTGTWMENKHSIKFKIVKFIKLRLSSKIRASLYNKLINK